MIIDIINGGVSWAKDAPIEYDWIQAMIKDNGKEYKLEFDMTQDCSRSKREIYIEFRDKNFEKIAKKNGFVIQDNFREINLAWEDYSNKHFRS